MKTKKQIRETYKSQLSMNRVTDDLINNVREYLYVHENNPNPTIEQVVETAYAFQHMKFNPNTSDFC